MIISIRKRLTIFYSIAGFALLSLIAFLLHLEFSEVLDRADFRFLEDEAATVSYLLGQNGNNQNALKKIIVHPEENGTSMYKYYVRVFTLNHAIIAETKNMPNVLPMNNGLPIVYGKDLKRRYWRKQFADKDYLIMQKPIFLDNKKQLGYIQIALDISYQHSIISDRKILLLILSAGGFGAFLIGFVIAQRGMKSLSLLTKAVKDITASTPNKRINLDVWPMELIDLAHAFNNMLARFEATFNRLKEFSSDLAHELRTPINNLIGETEIALTYPQSDNDYRKIMTSNMEELHKLNKVIENILFLAQTENPHWQIEKQTIHINKEISNVISFYEALIEEKQLTITHNGDANCKLNALMFRRLISNLLSNAIKYTKEKGAIHISTQQENNAVKITISDDGVGIAHDHIPRIFDRFYRVDKARSSTIQGTGLGLAIVKSIVDLHQGQIQIESEFDVGTRVIIHLPIE